MRNDILLAATAAALLAGTAVGHADTLAGGPLTPGAPRGTCRRGRPAPCSTPARTPST